MARPARFSQQGMARLARRGLEAVFRLVATPAQHLGAGTEAPGSVDGPAGLCAAIGPQIMVNGQGMQLTATRPRPFGGDAKQGMRVATAGIGERDRF